MALNVVTISLGPKAWSSFMEHHFQGAKTPKYYSKQLVVTDTLNHRLIIHSSDHM